MTVSSRAAEIHPPSVLAVPLSEAGTNAPIAELGRKGAGLAAMVSMGLPVPPGFVLSTTATRQLVLEGWTPALERALKDAVDGLAVATGRRLGGDYHPLLLSARSSGTVSMPGMLDTVLYIGAEGAAEALRAVLGGDAASDILERAAFSWSAVVGPTAPDDPFIALREAVEAVVYSWEADRARRFRAHEGIDDDGLPAVVVQAMVLGMVGDVSGAGVALSRDLRTGERTPTGDLVIRADGADVVSGKVLTRPLGAMISLWPEVWKQLVGALDRLDEWLGGTVEVEFTVEEGSLWLLQVRPARRSRPLSLGVESMGPADGADSDSVYPSDVIATGLAASPGVATGHLCTEVEDAIAQASTGVTVVLARAETSPADVAGLTVAAGLVTARGGLVSHAATVARSWGIPAVVGIATMDVRAEGVQIGDMLVPLGSLVVLDGDRGELAVCWSAGARRASVPTTPTSGADGSDGSDLEALVGEETPNSVRHLLSICGRVTPPDVVRRSMLDENEARLYLDRLTAAGQVVRVGSAYRLTDAGRDAHERALGAWRRSAGLAPDILADFSEVNDELKYLAATRQGQPVTPGDTDAVRDLVARLGAALGPVRSVAPWIARYEERLEVAINGLAEGDAQWLTGVDLDSVHSVWMELHADLLLTLGLERGEDAL